MELSLLKFISASPAVIRTPPFWRLDFRKLHLEEFGNLFVQVVMMAREAGLVKMGTVAVDGTKMRANASKRKAMSYERMKKQETELGEQIRDLLNRATATDEEEDQLDELPDGLSTRKKRLATMGSKNVRWLRTRKRDGNRETTNPDAERSHSNAPWASPHRRPRTTSTDPESRIMKTSTGYPAMGEAVVDSRPGPKVTSKSDAGQFGNRPWMR